MHVSGPIVSSEHNFSGGLDRAEMTVLENLTLKENLAKQSWDCFIGCEVTASIFVY